MTEQPPVIWPYRLPKDLLIWGWEMAQMKRGPRKNPTGWTQFIFGRWHGLAEGDDDLDPTEMRHVRVRMANHDEAFAAAIAQMRTISATLAPHEDYKKRFQDMARNDPRPEIRCLAGY